MAESQTVVILRNKRDDIALAITTYERELERARAAIAAVRDHSCISFAALRPSGHRSQMSS